MFKIEAYLREHASRQITFWKSKDKISKPRTAVELAILQSRPLVPISEDELEGAEWWCRNHSVASGMNLHVDQDLETTDRKNSVPAFSSVLYLSDVGGPTYVMNQVAGETEGLQPAVPTSGSLAFPHRGLFIVFRGNLVHGVLNPTVSHKGHRLSVVINWWRRKPSPPACDALPKDLRKLIEIKATDSDKASITPAAHQVSVSCASPSQVVQGNRYSNFSLYNVPLPVPSLHEPGRVLALDFKRSAEFAADRSAEL